MNNLKDDAADGGDDTGPENLKYWLAVNRGTVTPSPIPMPMYPDVYPTPELLIGFDSEVNQQATYAFMLEGPLEYVQKFVAKGLPRLVKHGAAVVKTFHEPGKPNGYIAWRCGSEQGHTY
jgi:hypothetical protein